MTTQEEIRSLTRREEFGNFLNAHNMKGVGVEVGTFKGEFATQLLGQWEGTCLHTCDPWKHYEGYVDGCVKDYTRERNEADLEAYRKEAYERLKVFGPKVEIHRMTGLECLNRFPDNSLDFVYLDGAHDYPTVKPEFELAWTKVVRGGIVASHDCYHHHNDQQHCGVWDLVWEKAHELRIKPHVTPCTSVWFVRP